MKHFRGWVTLLVFGALLGVAAMPVSETVRAPAVFSIADRQEVFAPAAGIVTDEFVKVGQRVKQGEPLIRLQSPDLEHQLQQAQRGKDPLRWQVERQGLDERLREQGRTLGSRLAKAAETVQGLSREKDRLTINAPMDGVVLERNDQINKQGWVAARESLYFIGAVGNMGAMGETQVDAFVGDDMLERLRVGAKARFVPESLDWQPVDCTVMAIDRINIGVLDKPALASVYGGDIAVKADTRNGLVPVAATFRVRLGECASGLKSAMELRGTALIEADRVSPLMAMYRRIVAVLNREMGF